MKHKVYLDYASTTPVDSTVFKKMKPYFTDDFFNPSSIYSEGVRVRNIVEDARKKVSTLLRAHADEIIFTGSGTESNNMSMLGIVRAFQVLQKKEKGKEKEDKNIQPHIIVSSIEHPSVLEICKQLEKEDVEVSYVLPNKHGIISATSIAELLKENTVLVSIILANNEIGVIQPIKEIVKSVRQYRKKMGRAISTELAYPYIHTDASQAANYIDIDVQKNGIDLMVLDGSKIYGPKGIGMLYVKRGVEMKPIMFGGSQEHNRRAGTEHVSNIIGFTEALHLTRALSEKESARLIVLRDYFISKLLTFPNTTLNGSHSKGTNLERLPNNINICFLGEDAEYLVFYLDARGVLCSSVTSCKSTTEDSSSYVVESLGKDNCATSSLRFSLGRQTTKKDLDKTLTILKEYFNKK